VHLSYKNERLKVLLMLAALANWLHYILVLSFNYLGMRLCRLTRLTISTQYIQAAVMQIMTWADEWDWKNI
jgi:hypothetical protein